MFTLRRADERGHMNHGWLDSFHSFSFADLQVSANADNIKRGIDLWGERVLSLHELATTIMWHVEYHLRNRRNPAMDLKGPMHESYLQFLSDLEQETKKIMDGAKTINREEFTPIHDEEYFRKQ